MKLARQRPYRCGECGHRFWALDVEGPQSASDPGSSTSVRTRRL